MANKPSSKEFGKRRPQAERPTPQPPVKRSGHVALLVMGTIAVGTTAYTLMPRQHCEPTPGAVPGQTTTTCSSSSSSSSGGSGGSRWSSRSSFFSSDSSSHSSSGLSSDSGHSSSVSRGGFGSFGHGFSGGG